MICEVEGCKREARPDYIIDLEDGRIFKCCRLHGGKLGWMVRGCYVLTYDDLAMMNIRLREPEAPRSTRRVAPRRGGSRPSC